jgi:enterochelin esterase-like enzyme
MVVAGSASLWASSAASAPPSPTVASEAPVWVLPPVDDPAISRRILESAAVGGPVSFEVALPEPSAVAPGACVPVLYWLHGTGGGAEGVSRVAAWVRAAIAAGEAPPMMVVFPNGLPHHLWSDSVDGRAPVETMLVDELTAFVDAEFPTIPLREARWIAGFSMGGYGSARIALRHPERFSSSLVIAPGPLDEAFDGARAIANPALREVILRDVYGGDLAAFAAQSPLRIVREADPLGVRAVSWWVAVGDRDPSAPVTLRLGAALAATGAAVQVREVPGLGHQPAELLTALRGELWAWYRAQAAAIPADAASACARR